MLLKPIARCFFFMALTLIAFSARAQSYVFSNMIGGDWTVATNWTPNGVPGAGDSATIALTNTGPTVSTAITVANVTMANSSTLSIAGGGTLTVTAAMNITSINNVGGAGTLVIPVGSVLTTNTAVGMTTSLGINLKNDGTVTCNTGFLSINTGVSTGTFNATQPNTLIIMPTAGGNTMEIAGGALNGHFQVGGAGNSVLQIDPANFNFAGTIDLYDFLNGAGSLNLQSGGLINIRGPGFTRIPGFNIPVHINTGATVHLISDTFNNNLGIASSLLVDGTLQFDPDCNLMLNTAASTLTLNSNLNLIGKITGTGTTTLNAGKTITCSTTTGLTQIISNFDNLGTVTINSGKLEIGNTTNEASGILTISAGTELSLVQGIKLLTNSGAINGTGTLRVKNGTVILNGALAFGGNLILDNGFVVGAGSMTLNNPLTLAQTSGFNTNGIQLPTTFPSTSGITVDTNRSLAFTGNNFTFDCPVTVNTGSLSIDASHTLTFNNALNLTAGTLNGGGNFVLSSTATLTGSAAPAGTVIGTISGSLANNGTIALGTPTGTLTISGNYTQTSTASLSLSLGGALAGAFDQLIVNGTATLDGTFTASLGNNFTPVLPSELILVQYFTLVGNWAIKTLPAGIQDSLIVGTSDVRIDFGTPQGVPTISTLLPSQVDVGHADLGLIIMGSGFFPDSVVKFNGQVRVSETLSPTELLVFLPSTDFLATESASIVVSNATHGGGDSASSPLFVGSSNGNGLVVSKLLIKLYFKKSNSDGLELIGSIPMTQAPVVGSNVTVDIGGAFFNLILNNKGIFANNIKNGPTLKFSKPVRGMASFTFKVAKTTVSQLLIADKLTLRDTKNEVLPVSSTIFIGPNSYTAIHNVKYTASVKTGIGSAL